MLLAEQMQNLRKANVSRNAEKTKARIAEDFKSTTSINKNSIVELSGLKRATFYRVFETGAATAKVVLSMAQILDVSPYYYTGIEDIKGSCTDETIERFLWEHGYKTLVEQIKNLRNGNFETQNKNISQTKFALPPGKTERVDRNNIHPEPAAKPPAKPLQEDSIITIEIELEDSQIMKDAVASLDEETSFLLLKSLYKRAEANAYAKELSDVVKRCLLS